MKLEIVRLFRWGIIVSDDDRTDESDVEPVRRGWKRLLLPTGLVLGLVLGGLVIARWQVGRLGDDKLTDVVKKIEDNERSWKCEEIDSERLGHLPPPDENSAPLVLRLAEEIPPGWNQWRSTAKWLIAAQDNRLPSSNRLQELDYYREATRAVREHARSLENRPNGGYSYNWPDNPVQIITSLPHIESAGKVLSLLEYDARLAILDGDPNRAIRDARAALNLARSIGDEPSRIAQTWRMVFRMRAATLALGTLALSTPTQGLEQLQNALEADADEPLFLNGARGERAAFHRLFESLETGRVGIETVLPPHGEITTPLAEPAIFQVYRPLLPDDHAEFIRLYTEFIAAAQLPWNEQREAITGIKLPNKDADDLRHSLTRLLFPPLDRIHLTVLQNRAHLLVAVAAIACERFRQLRGRWPQDLSEIPQTILAAIPSSPFDGEPVRYQVLANRVVLTCYCWNRGSKERPQIDFRDQKAGPVEFRYSELPGVGIAATLWNTNLRGLPFQETKEP
jgi:hypothetical protein